MSKDRLKTRARSSYKYFMNGFQTRWADNDQYGHVNNAAYYYFYDTIINTYLIETGLLNPKSDVGPIGLCVKSESFFFKPLEFPSKLDLGLMIVKLGNSSVTYEVGVFAQNEHDVCAVGYFIHVFCDSLTRRPIKLDQHWKTELSRITVNGNGEDRNHHQNNLPKPASKL